MADIEIKIDERQLRNMERMLAGIPKEIPRAQSRAINRTAAPIRTQMARQITPKVNEEVAVVAARQKAAGRSVAGRVSAKTGKIRRFRFKVSTIKKNIRFDRATFKKLRALIWIKRPKGQEATPTTETPFIQRMKGGHISIFQRLGKTKIPIADQLRNLMLKDFTGIKASIKQQAQQRLVRNMNDQVKLILNKWKSKARKAG